MVDYKKMEQELDNTPEAPLIPPKYYTDECEEEGLKRFKEKQELAGIYYVNNTKYVVRINVNKILFFKQKEPIAEVKFTINHNKKGYIFHERFESIIRNKLVNLKILKEKEAKEWIASKFYSMKKIHKLLDIERFEEEEKKLEEHKKSKNKIEITKDVSLSEVRSIIAKHFPEMWFTTKTCMAVICTLCLEDSQNVVAVNLEGSPSSTKTTILSFFYNLPGITYKSDDFTPAAFVSHSAQISKEELENIDLLPRIKYHAFIVPELAPLFNKRKEDLIQNIGVLTRVFDGEGYESDSGSQGKRGYTGDYLFAWLGATTPISHSVWKVMGKLGARMFSLTIPEKNKSVHELKNVMKNTFKHQVNECRDIISNYVKKIWKINNGARGVKWDKEQDSEDAMEIIVVCSQLVRRFRATVEVWKTKSEDGDNLYDFKAPQVEEPERIISVFYNVTRGNAIILGRNYIKKKDTDIIIALTLCTMPEDRRTVIRALFLNNGSLTTSELAIKIKCCTRQARNIMDILTILGICSKEKINDGTIGKPEYRLKWSQGFKKNIDILLSHGVNFSSVNTFENIFGNESDTVIRDFDSKNDNNGNEITSVIRNSIEKTSNNGNENDGVRANINDNNFTNELTEIDKKGICSICTKPNKWLIKRNHAGKEFCQDCVGISK